MKLFYSVYLPVCILLLEQLEIKAQNRVTDSLQNALASAKEDTNKVNILNLLVNQFINSEPKKALDYAQRGLKLSEQLKWKKGIAKSRQSMGYYYYTQGDYTNTLTFWQSALTLNEELKDKTGIAKCLGNIGRVYRDQADYSKAMDYYFKALKLYEELSDKNGMAALLDNIGTVYGYQDNNREALDYFFRALSISKELGNKKIIASTLGNIGNIYCNQADYPNALKYYFMALKRNEELADKSSIALTHCNIGNVYYELADYPKALEYYLKALREFEELGNKYGITIQVGNVGMVYVEQATASTGAAKAELLSKALDNYLRALAMAEELGDKNGVARYLGSVGLIYSLQDDYPKAIEFNFRALKIAEQLGDKSIIAVQFGRIGSLYTKVKKYSEAEEYLKKALALSKELKMLLWERDQQESYSKLDIVRGNYKGALEHYKLYIAARDSINNEENIKKQTQQEMQYEFDKKEAINKAEQDQKDALAREELEKKKMQRNGFIGGFALMLGLAGVSYRSYRNKQKANKVISKQKEEVEKQKEIVEQQKHLIEEKHKEITDSINYAERIQRSFLATKEVLNNNLPDYFIFFRPKDVVSGDFYWASVVNDGRFALVTADSTGHGVPGAIMSLLNITSLEKAIERHSEPAEILNSTRKTIIERLKKDGSAEGGKDGMDCSLLVLDSKTKSLSYAAANNPVWIVRNGELIELDPDKMPVGKHDKDIVPFSQHIVKLELGDMLYALTDGMPDQFVGPKGKKFMYKPLKNLFISIAGLSSEKQKEKIEAAFNEWRGDLEQVDDVTVVGIRI